MLFNWSGKRDDKRPSSKKNSGPTLIGEGADTAFDAYLREWVSYTRLRLTAPKILAILEGAEDGAPSEQAALFQAIQEKEPVISAHLQTRKLAVLARDWRIVSPAPERRAALTATLRRAGMYGLCRHLLDAIAGGYSGSVILWEEGGGGVRGFQHVHPSNWSFDAAGRPSLITRAGETKPLDEFHPNQFVFHTHGLKPGVPARGGLLRALVWLYFFKHYAVRDRARFLERFGVPFLIAKISDRDFEDGAVRENIKKALVRIGSDGVGVTTANSAIDILEPARGGGDEFHSWFKYIDDVYALTILGQLASSGPAGGLSKGQTQSDVRQDLLEADCRNLMESINRQIVAPLERGLYDGPGSAEFQIDCEPPEDLYQKAQIIRELSQAGYKVDPAYVAETFKMPLAAS